MKLIVLVCAFGLTVATPLGGITSQQYHAQDELGQYTYGYSGGPSSKHETKTADGITRGGYSYIDAHGLVQSAEYISDPHNGFRVAATNLPVGPAVPAKPAVVAAAPAVVAAPTLVAAAPAVVAAQPAVISSGLPEVIAARSLLSHNIWGAQSWNGLVHHLKKRSIAAIVPTYTNYPGDTAPLVRSVPVVAHAPVLAHSQVIASPVLAHSVVPSIYSHPWSGLSHVLKKRSLALVSPYAAHLATPLYAHGLYAGPLEHPHVAIAKQAHLIQQHNEAVRNTHGIIPAWSPADTPEVAITKQAHLIQQAHEAVRNTHGLVKRSAVLAASPLVYSSPLIHSHAYVNHVSHVSHIPVAHAPLAYSHPIIASHW